MARRGRGSKRRKDGERGVSGRLLERQNEQHIIPPEALARRAEALGMNAGSVKRGAGRPANDAPNIAKVDASSALGVLHGRRIIGQHHYDAGLKLAEAHRRWASASAAKPRTAEVAGIFGPDDGPPPREIEAEEWARIKARFIGARDAVPRGLCWSLVEAVVLDNFTPPRVIEGELVVKLRAELLRGMDALCQFFGIGLHQCGFAERQGAQTVCRCGVEVCPLSEEGGRKIT